MIGPVLHWEGDSLLDLYTSTEAITDIAGDWYKKSCQHKSVKDYMGDETSLPTWHFCFKTIELIFRALYNFHCDGPEKSRCWLWDNIGIHRRIPHLNPGSGVIVKSKSDWY